MTSQKIRKRKVATSKKKNKEKEVIAKCVSLICLLIYCQRAVHTETCVLTVCFAPGKLIGVLHKMFSHNLQIPVCLAENDMFCRKTWENLDPFSSLPGFLAKL